MATTIQLKRKQSSSSWDGILKVGEPLFDIASNQLYVGDGSHHLSDLTPIGGGVASSAVTVTTNIKNQAITDIFETGTGGISAKVKNATTADKLSRGISVPSMSAIKPSFIQDDGTLAACSTYAGGTAVTLNGVIKSGLPASFYAPDSAGQSDGQLVAWSSASASPVWVTPATKDVSIESESGLITVQSTVSGASDVLTVSGTNSLRDVVVYGNGHFLRLNSNVTIDNTTVTYTDIYKNLSTDSNGNFLGATFNIDFDKYIITNITVGSVSAPYASIFIYGGEGTTTATLYRPDGGGTQYIVVTKSADTITLRAYGIWVNSPILQAAITYIPR